MIALISALLHPLNTINLWLDGDADASARDVFYLLSLFLGFGGWLVFDRYQKAVNSAVPFSWRAPEVSVEHLDTVITYNLSPRFPARRSQLGVIPHSRTQLGVSFDATGTSACNAC